MPNLVQDTESISGSVVPLAMFSQGVFLTAAMLLRGTVMMIVILIFGDRKVEIEKQGWELFLLDVVLMRMTIDKTSQLLVNYCKRLKSS